MPHRFKVVLCIFFCTPFLWAAEVDRLYFQRDQPSKAERALMLLQKERQANPKNDEVLWRLARALKWEGDQKKGRAQKTVLYERAVEAAKEAVEINPKSVGGHFWMGVAMGKIGETRGVFRSLFLVDPIKKEMETVLSLNPNHGGAHLVLGVMYRKLPGFFGGSNKRSIDELKIAISVEPRRTLPYLELAITYLEEDREKEAGQTLHTLLSVTDPLDPVESRKDKEEAKEMLSRIETGE